MVGWMVFWRGRGKGAGCWGLELHPARLRWRGAPFVNRIEEGSFEFWGERLLWLCMDGPCTSFECGDRSSEGLKWGMGG